MVGFNADQLLTMFDVPEGKNYMPFYSGLSDMMITGKILEECRKRETFDDASFLSYLVLIDNNLDFYLRNETNAQHVLVENMLVELQGLIYHADECDISEEFVALAKQLMFKASADLLTDSKNNPTAHDLVPILSSLSFQAVSCVTFEQPEVAAWSAAMTLDSLTLLFLTCERIHEFVWHDPLLGSRLVTGLIPRDGSLCRLHSRIFEDARGNCENLLPCLPGNLSEWLADKIKPHLEADKMLRVLVVAARRSSNTVERGLEIDRLLRHLVKHLIASPYPEIFLSCSWNTFTTSDFLLYFQWLIEWSILSQCTLEIEAKVAVTREQLNHWKTIVNFVRCTNGDISLEDKLRLPAAIAIVRLRTPSRNIRLLYSIFIFMRIMGFEKIWTDNYAQFIMKTMTEYIENPKDHHFRLKAIDDEVTVDVEDQINQAVTAYLSNEEEEEEEEEENGYPGDRDDDAKIIQMWNELTSEEEKHKMREDIQKIKNNITNHFQQPPGIPEDQISDQFFDPGPAPGYRNMQVTPSYAERAHRSDYFPSPSTRDFGTSPDTSFLSAFESPTQMEEAKTPVNEEKPTQLPLPPGGSSQPAVPDQEEDFTEEEEEQYYLKLAEIKMASNARMYQQVRQQIYHDVDPEAGRKQLSRETQECYDRIRKEYAAAQKWRQEHEHFLKNIANITPKDLVSTSTEEVLPTLDDVEL